MSKLFTRTDTRRLRVFVSSTFLDLEEERNYLVKIVFPQIRKLCRQRNIEFTEVDLRWGVTEEESKQGKVIHICLSEIDRSHPYFIGILGERYGWIPTGEDLMKYDKILEDFVWIRQDVEVQMSITEMEIQYGVLRNERYRSDSSPNAFFYIKSGTQTERKYDDGALDQSRLDKLKQRLWKQKLFPVNSFVSKEDLGLGVFADLERIINERFPEERPLSYREKVLAEHIQHAIGKQHHFIGNQGFLARLDHFFETGGKPLVITGESGCGKTALLANWIRSINENHPDTFLFFHFCGGASDSTNHIRILQRLLEEVKFHFGIETDIPSEAKQIVEIVPDFLARAQRPGEKWLLLIDGINQVEDEENARLLNWLPEFFPSHIRVVFSCLEGDSLNVLKRRNYQVKELSGIHHEDRKLFIATYLEQYSKKLSLSNVNLILSDDRSENPLFLKTLLEEVRIFGAHDKLGGHIQRFLDTNGIPAFFDEVLLRMEEDYEENQPGMVCMVLSLIFGSRAGLSEKEILEITGVKPVYWSHFLHAIEAHMVAKSGLFNFGHDYLKFAVEKRYLPDAEKKKAVHQRLADYFQAESLSQRSMVEFPYHLIEAGNHEGLIRYISDPDMLVRQIELNKIGLMIWLTKVNLGGGIQKTIYRKISVKRSFFYNDIKEILKIAAFFNEMSFYDEAISISNILLKRIQGKAEHKEIEAEVYNQRGFSYHSLGKYNSAIDDYNKCLNIQKKIFNYQSEKVAKTLNLIGFTLHWKSELKEAFRIYKEALKIRRKIHNSDVLEIAESLNHIGILAIDNANYKYALDKLFKGLTIRLKILGNLHPDVAECYNNIGLTYHYLGDYKKAEEYFTHDLNVSKTVLGENHSLISTTYHNLGMLYIDIGDIDKGIRSIEDSLRIWQLNIKTDNTETATAYAGLGVAYIQKGDYIKALEYFEKDFELCTKEYDLVHLALAPTYTNFGILYCKSGNYDKALKNLHLALECYKTEFKGIHPDSVDAICMIGLAQLLSGDKEISIKNLNLALSTCQKNFGKRHLFNAMIYECLGQYYGITGDFVLAEFYYLKALKLWDKKLPPIHYETADTLLLLSELYLKLGKYKVARKYLLRARDCFEHYQIKPEIDKINSYLSAS